MKISVIIPQHKENLEKIGKLLNSINLQYKANFDELEILIINDSKEYKLDEKDIRKKYKNLKNIVLLENEKEGYPGISRQIGIDNAHGDYLIFCDADDMIASFLFLKECEALIDSDKNSDIFIFDFSEELNANSKISFKVHQDDFTWMFGKLYKTEFIRKNNIRFSNSLRVHEDTYFNILFQACQPRVRTIHIVEYLWSSTEDSITRINNSEYTFNSIETFIDATDMAFEEVLKRSLGNFTGNIAQIIGYIYYLLQTKIFQSERAKEFIPGIENRLAKFMIKYSQYLKAVDETTFIKILNQEYQKHVGKYGEFLPVETWFSFRDRILKPFEIKKEDNE